MMKNEQWRVLKMNSAKIRSALLRVLKHKGGGHIGGSLSIVEALSTLYTCHMRFDPANPQDPNRDFLVLSKGHAGPGLYAALSVFGFFPEKELDTMNEGGTCFPSHPDRSKTPGVDATTGSLGQGISVAGGLGYALKLEKKDQYVYAIMGDGELNEGQCWEAFQFLAHNRLNNVIVMIDENKRQLDGFTHDIMNPFDIGKKMEAFGFAVRNAAGGDEQSISEAIDWAKGVENQAVCIVLDTIKGQGVAYFENMADNHSVQFKAADYEAVDEALKLLEPICRGDIAYVE